MATKKLPSIEQVRKYLKYEPFTGKLYWLPREPSDFVDGRHSASHTAAKWNAHYADREAFTSTTVKGYKQGSLIGGVHRAHRIIWALVYGEWPDQVDHINGDPSDNRLNNLRSIPNNTNQMNMKKPRDNTSGHIGVCWDAEKKRWLARVGRKHIGRFDSVEEAAAAQKLAALAMGYHRNHGR
jgi:hypothetical protein